MECGLMDDMIYGVWVNGWRDKWSVGSWMAWYMECGLMDGVIYGLIYGVWVNGLCHIWNVGSWMAWYMVRGLMDGVIYWVWVNGWSDIWSVSSWMEWYMECEFMWLWLWLNCLKSLLIENWTLFRLSGALSENMMIYRSKWLRVPHRLPMLLIFMKLMNPL